MVATCELPVGDLELCAAGPREEEHEPISSELFRGQICNEANQMSRRYGKTMEHALTEVSNLNPDLIIKWS